MSELVAAPCATAGCENKTLFYICDSCTTTTAAGVFHRAFMEWRKIREQEIAGPVKEPDDGRHD
jgi:hypothetical protein